MDELYLRYLAISVYKRAAENIKPLAVLLRAQTTEEKISLAAEVFDLVFDAGSSTTGGYIQTLIERDDNAFSRAAAKGERINPALKKQVESELVTFRQLAMLRPEQFATDETAQFFPKFGSGGLSVTYDKLTEFYGKNGSGELSGGNTFAFTGDGFKAVAGDAARLSDLVNYDEEKAEIVRNTENFLKGLPAFHTLLYGDRGTGKSTTVRALASEYAELKIIELDARRLDLLPTLTARLSDFKQKFIVFIDDLVFDENDGRAEAFKAALDGSLAGGGKNTLIYCTSNRRHLIKETDKSALKNRGDETQAELALFDRFGLVVTYIAPDKDGFLDIFKSLLRARGIKWREEYASIAELAALKKGGRTPRAAKQIADLIEATYAELR